MVEWKSYHQKSRLYFFFYFNHLILCQAFPKHLKHSVFYTIQSSKQLHNLGYSQCLKCSTVQELEAQWGLNHLTKVRVKLQCQRPGPSLVTPKPTLRTNQLYWLISLKLINQIEIGKLQDKQFKNQGPGLGLWFEWQNTCLANVRPFVQTPGLPK